jgi:ribonuclease G
LNSTSAGGHERLVGNIYNGKVQNVLPGMQAAFIDIGLERNAFLYAGDIVLSDDPTTK